MQSAQGTKSTDYVVRPGSHWVRVGKASEDAQGTGSNVVHNGNELGTSVAWGESATGQCVIGGPEQLSPFQQMQHHEYMVNQFVSPCLAVVLASIVSVTVAYLVRLNTKADLIKNERANELAVKLRDAKLAAKIQMNEQDNAADVRDAQRILEDRDQGGASAQS